MRKYLIPLGLLLFAGSLILQPQEKAEEFSTYAEMRKRFSELYQQKRLKEAAGLLEGALSRFPDHLEANAFNLAYVYGQLKEYDRGIGILKYAFDRGVWFNIYMFNKDAWAMFREREEFEEILARNEALRQEAQKHVRPEFLVLTPKTFNGQRKYPLFVALHGGGGNAQEFKDAWTSRKLREEFIRAYFQSSQIVSLGGFSWTEDIALAKKEISEAFQRVKKIYPVDENEVLIGGFSSGAIAALEVALGDVIPVAGFVVLCPAMPEAFSAGNVRGAKDRGLRGTLLTTGRDPNLPAQKEMAEVCKSEGFPLQFIVTPGIGHGFPEDMEEKIDRAIDFIRQAPANRSPQGGKPLRPRDPEG